MEEIKLMEEFEELANNVIPKEGIKWLIDNGFFTQACSTKYHLNYKGGLAEHSIHVAEQLLMLTKKNNLNWQRPESPIIIGLLHDVCKIDSYRLNVVKNQYEWNSKQKLLGHGDKSVKYIKDNIMSLTDEEELCILQHMGGFGASIDKQALTDYTNAVKKNVNVLWTHTADMLATNVIEK